MLAYSPLLSRLRGIDLSLNRIDDDGGRALADHEGRGILGTLDLIYNPLGAEVREVLRRRFGPDVCLFTR